MKNIHSGIEGCKKDNFSGLFVSSCKLKVITVVFYDIACCQKRSKQKEVNFDVMSTACLAFKITTKKVTSNSVWKPISFAETVIFSRKVSHATLVFCKNDFFVLFERMELNFYESNNFKKRMKKHFTKEQQHTL